MSGKGERAVAQGIEILRKLILRSRSDSKGEQSDQRQLYHHRLRFSLPLLFKYLGKMDSKVVYYDPNFLKIGHTLTTNPHEEQFKHALMYNHPIIISVELVSLVESHVVELCIKFKKKKKLVQE